MSVAEKVFALLTVLRPEDVRALPMAKRQHFGQLCRHVADLAERDNKPRPKAAGVLSLLNGGDRAP